MLSLEVLLRAAGAVMAIATGMALVSAMAIQNAAHRTHLGSAPPSTLMTGATTQLMIDLADRLRGLPTETAATTRR